MKVGIGLPDFVPGLHLPLVLEWAARADAGPFSSLATADTFGFVNYDSLVLLAAVAGITKRTRLMTAILVAPLRNAGILAKQATTLDLLSGGRLTLGMSVGGNESGYRVAPADFQTRGKRFDQMLDVMKRIWSGQPLAEDLPVVRPLPAQQGGPELLIGGQAPAAIARVGKWADGYIISSNDPAQVLKQHSLAQESWAAHGRAGKLRLVGRVLFALGPQARERAAGYFEGNRRGGPIPQFSPREVRDTVGALSDTEMDEIIFIPCVGGLDQLDRLADAVAPVAQEVP